MKSLLNAILKPFKFLFSFNQASFSGLMDIIVVKGNNNIYKSTAFHVRFGHFKTIKYENIKITIEINGKLTDLTMLLAEDGHAYFLKENNKQSLRLHNDELKSLDLKFGCNKIKFICETDLQGKQWVEGRIFLWEDNNLNVIFSDIDGTVTKSDVMGHIMASVGGDWTHENIAKLFTKFDEKKCKIIYITARPFSQYNYTKEYLDKVNQDGFLLPEGPILMSPDVLIDSAKREVVFKTPEKSKIPILQDVRKLSDNMKFIAGFGNRDSDAISYIYVGIYKKDIYIINKQSQIQKLDCAEIMTYNTIYENFNRFFAL